MEWVAIIMILWFAIMYVAGVCLNNHEKNHKRSQFDSIIDETRNSWRNDTKNTFSDAERARKDLQHDMNRINSNKREP